MRYLLLILISISTFISRAQSVSQGVYYEIFVRSFCDSNGDGIGDIPGITAQLPYLRQLGITGIWLTPFHPSPTYHKYDVMNYTEVDPEYGTLADVDTLLAHAHALGMHVLMDFVVNHTAVNHPWFKASASGDKKFVTWYSWQAKKPVVDSVHWYPNPLANLPLMKTLPKYYYGFFWMGMPDLNFDNQAVRDTIIGTARFWLRRGFDGFRLDAAQHIYDANDPGPNAAWWRYFRKRLQPEFPHLFLLGEVWNTTERVKKYLNGAMDACFNFDLSFAIQHAYQTDSAQGLIANFMATRKEYLAVNRNFVDATFLTNHDQDRIASVLNNNVADLKSAFVLLMTLPGTPFLYYGEELGMLGKFPDESRREPFPWGPKGTGGNTTWEPYRFSAQVAPFTEQVADSTSLLRFYKKGLAFRQANPWIATANVEDFYDPKFPSVIRYRTWEWADDAMGHSVDVVINLGDDTLTIPLPPTMKIVVNPHDYILHWH